MHSLEWCFTSQGMHPINFSYTVLVQQKQAGRSTQNWAERSEDKKRKQKKLPWLQPTMTHPHVIIKIAPPASSCQVILQSQIVSIYATSAAMSSLVALPAVTSWPNAVDISSCCQVLQGWRLPSTVQQPVYVARP